MPVIPEPTPVTVPLPCFGLEYSPRQRKCQDCPHQTDCKVYMGSKLDKVPLDKVLWNIVPENYGVEAYGYADDLEQPHLRRLYEDCYRSVFGELPKDASLVSLHQRAIVKNAMAAECSVRLFMLACMVAHKMVQEDVVRHTEKLEASNFSAVSLTKPGAVSKAIAYKEVCAREFGTYSPTSLLILAKERNEKSQFESFLDGLLSSEITAAKNLIQYKIHHSGPWEQAAYESDELSLSPHWLALEEDYVNKVLNPYLENPKRKKVSRAIYDHRYNVLDTIKFLKKNPSYAKTLWLWRQQIMPKAVLAVLRYFNLRTDDFLYSRNPVRKTMDFWKTLALAIRHYHCWLYVQGLPSFFTRRVLTGPKA